MKTLIPVPQLNTIFLLITSDNNKSLKLFVILKVRVTFC